jgi:glycine betaine catabolism B
MEYTVRVLELVPRRNAAFSVRFSRPDAFSFLPGQFIFISIGRGTPSLTKHLSLSGSPSDPFLEVTKGSTGHPFAEALRALSPGDEVLIRGPLGSFTFRGEFGSVAFIAGGIGITSLWSMIRNATDMLYDTDITLLYSVKSEPEILFREMMPEIAEANLHLSMVITLTEPGAGWIGHTGRISRGMIEEEIPDWRTRVFYISGPPAMVDAIRTILREMGLPEDQARHEYSTGY